MFDKVARCKSACARAAHLKMVLPPRVRGGGRQQHVNSIPDEMKRRREAHERRQNARVIVQVLDRMHGEAGKRLYIRIAVVQRVHLGPKHTRYAEQK